MYCRVLFVNNNELLCTTAKYRSTSKRLDNTYIVDSHLVFLRCIIAFWPAHCSLYKNTMWQSKTISVVCHRIVVIVH